MSRNSPTIHSQECKYIENLRRYIMRKFFMTFVEVNETKLNEQIEKFAQEHGYEEIQRSAPVVMRSEGFLKIAVTSTFANSDDVRNDSLPDSAREFLRTFGK